MNDVLAPALDTPSGVSKYGATFAASFKGDRETSWQWANYAPSIMSGFNGAYGYGGMFLSPLTRQHGMIATVATDLAQSDPVLAAIIEQLATQAVGDTGLTLSLRIAQFADVLKLTPGQARALANQIEREWRIYAGDAREVDAHGMHTLHQLAHAAFRSYLLTGEALVGLPFHRDSDTRYFSRTQLMSSAQIATDRTIRTDTGWIFEGVGFNKRSRVEYLMIRDQPLGDTIAVAQPKRVDLLTPWGRPRCLFLYDLIAPMSPRGCSPLAVALGSAKSKATISELTLGSFALQNSFGVVVSSDQSPEAAIRSVQVNDDLGNTKPFYDGAILDRAGYYESERGKVQLDVGKVTHMFPGDKISMVQPRAAGQEFSQIDTALLRQAASAAGVSYDQLASDYSKTSFSAAKLSQYIGHAINLRRRANIAARMYQSVFDAWLEEAVERGIVEWPEGALDYWDARRYVLAACVWRGPPKASAEPLKDTETSIKRINAGLSTITRECAELGEDFDAVVAERKAEIETLKAAGLWGVHEAVDNVTAQEVDKV